jgi:hypothetical protein
MNYYDSARPRQSNGLPQYVGYDGQPIAAIPHIAVTPREHGGYDLHVHLLKTNNSASPFDAIVADLGQFFAQLLLDPERVFTDIFGWSFKRSSPSSRPTFTLSDIGL